ncbi:MAG: hypothetical protein PHS59_08225 [Paludibacter sp.]|nr:hypothetical protein [Paludibacter sp.]
MKKFKHIQLLFLFIFLSIIQSANAHPLGLTFSNLKFSKGELSISTRMFYGDFYYEFQENSSVKNKNYLKEGFDKKDKKDLIKYFKTNIQIWIDNVPLHFKNYSFKFEQHDVDAYIFVVEMKTSAKIKKGSVIKIRDTVLLYSISNQKHLINVYLNNSENPSHGIITLNKNCPEYEFTNE